MIAYFAALDPMTLVRALPGNVAQGLIWGIMALGVYITFRILDFPDLTVDGTLATGGAVAVMLIQGGMHPAAVLIFSAAAGMLGGLVTGLLHTAFGIPGILASILTQISLYSVNLGIMGKANQSIGIGQEGLVASLRFVSADDSYLFFIRLITLHWVSVPHAVDAEVWSWWLWCIGCLEQRSVRRSVRRAAMSRWQERRASIQMLRR